MPRLYFGSRGGVYYRKNGRKVYVNQFAADEGTPQRSSRKRPPPGAPKKLAPNTVTQDMYNYLLSYVQCLIGILISSPRVSDPFRLMLNNYTTNNILLQWYPSEDDIISKYEQLYIFSQELENLAGAAGVNIDDCGDNPYETIEERNQTYESADKGPYERGPEDCSREGKSRKRLFG